MFTSKEEIITYYRTTYSTGNEKLKKLSKWDKIFDYNYINLDTPKGDYISNHLLEKFKYLDKSYPIFISAPTGSGKNHFIENDLLKYINKKNKAILILSNRRATDIASKTRISKAMGIYENRIKYYSNFSILQETTFGNATIMTYEAYYKSNEIIKRKFDYIVADECHFFWSDSSFNPHTEAILIKLLRHGKNTYTIFMTATSKNIFPLIQKYFDKINGNFYENKENAYLSQVYNFANKRLNYRDIYSFNNFLELDAIFRQASAKNKILAFVSSKKEGEKLKDKYKNAAFTNATNIKTDKNAELNYDNIVTTEKYSSDILISTSVLDNGINIKDDKISDIIIAADSYETFVQMLGRIRLYPEQNVTLYIYNYNLEDLRHKISHSNDILHVLYEFIKNNEYFGSKYLDNSNEVIDASKYVFHEYKNALCLNRIAISYYQQRIDELTFAMSLIEKNYIRNFSDYICYVWLNLNNPAIPIINYRNNFDIFMLESLDKEMDENAFTSFSETFVELYIKVFGTIVQPSRKKKVRAINNLLNNVSSDYIIVKNKDSWTVSKIDSDNVLL